MNATSSVDAMIASVLRSSVTSVLDKNHLAPVVFARWALTLSMRTGAICARKVEHITTSTRSAYAYMSFLVLGLKKMGVIP